MERTTKMGSCLAALMLWACNVEPQYGDLGTRPVDSASTDGGVSAPDLAPAPADLAGLCGDPVKLAAYPRCAAASDPWSCTAAGGRWNPGGIFPPWCQCPTGQEKCSCTKFSDCIAGCLSAARPCAEALMGSCADSSSLVGCLCILDNQGLPFEVCFN